MKIKTVQVHLTEKMKIEKHADIITEVLKVLNMVGVEEN